MIVQYLERAIKKAEYKQLEDSTWFGEIPGFDGVWANAESVELCREELLEVLEEWILLKISDKEVIPTIDNFTISFSKVAG